MKNVALATLSFGLLSAAFVLPDPDVFAALADGQEDRDEHSWETLWSQAPAPSYIETATEAVASGIDSAIHAALNAFSGSLDDQFVEDDEDDDDVDDDDDDDDDDEYDDDGEDDELVDRPRRRRRHRRGHNFPNLTIYQLITRSNHTTKFAKLVDEYKDIVDILNSTKANHTLFVPVDAAFEHIPKDKKPSKEFIENVLKYHIGLGDYPARKLLTTQTLPTVLKEKFLGDKPQRLRTSAGLAGIRVNFFTKLVVANIGAKNGIIHGVNHILVPPPFLGRELSLIPGVFSTLLLAYEKTNFTKYIHGVPMTGSTLFAPSNAAFARLGPVVNAYLFNTDKGLKILRALLKYQIVANTTFYSDAVYSNNDNAEVDPPTRRRHVELPTLLDDKTIAVDVAKMGWFVRMRVNGYVPVAVNDGVAKNGVLHVVGRVPIPPHKHRGKNGEENWGEDEDEIGVEELEARVADYVEDGDWTGTDEL